MSIQGTAGTQAEYIGVERPSRTRSAGLVLARRTAARFGREWAPPLSVIIGLLVLWQVLHATGAVKPYVLPGPGTVLKEFVLQRQVIVKHTVPTAYEALLGFAIGNSVAILLSILFVHSNIAERGLYPVALGFRSIPIVALAPILVLSIGNGMTPRALIAGLITFFPTLVNMMRGLRSVDSEAAELMHSLSASWWQVLWKLRWPASMPFLFAALKISAGTAFLGAVVAEWIGSLKGLGYLIILSGNQYRIPMLWAAIFAVSALALISFFLVSLLESYVLRWAKGGALPD